MLFYALLLTVLLLFVYVARKPRPVKNRQGTLLNNSYELVTEVQSELVVATYNVQTGKNLEGQRNINRAAQMIKEVDLIGIQEIYAKTWLNKAGLGGCQTQKLSVPGQFSWLFCPTRWRWFRENRGNAILSKIPIQRWQTVALPDKTGISFRNMTIATFTFNGQDCHFINTHLHTGKGQTEQLKAVLTEFDKYDRAILVGDFNISLEHPELKGYFASKGSAPLDVLANIQSDSEPRIDWIITRGWKVVNTTSIEKGISDHPYYQATLSLV